MQTQGEHAFKKNNNNIHNNNLEFHQLSDDTLRHIIMQFVTIAQCILQ